MAGRSGPVPASIPPVYEKVLIVGVSLGRLSGRRPSYVRIHCYGRDGVYRSWSAFTVSREKLAAGHLFSDTLTPLIEACSGKPSALLDLERCLREDDEAGTRAAECRIRDASVALLEELATAREGTEEQVSELIGKAVVGHIVRIDWEQRGEFGRLAPHALSILPSRDDGSSEFSGQPLEYWFDRYRQWRAGRPMDPRTARRSKQLGAQLLEMVSTEVTETVEDSPPAEPDDTERPF